MTSARASTGGKATKPAVTRHRSRSHGPAVAAHAQSRLIQAVAALRRRGPKPDVGSPAVEMSAVETSADDTSWRRDGAPLRAVGVAIDDVGVLRAARASLVKRRVASGRREVILRGSVMRREL